MKPGLLIATIFIRVPDFYYQLCCREELFGFDMIPAMQLGVAIYGEIAEVECPPPAPLSDST